MCVQVEVANAYLTSREAAAVLRIRSDYLSRLRSKSAGPPYIQIAARGPCLYKAEDLVRWLEDRTVQSLGRGCERWPARMKQDSTMNDENGNDSATDNELVEIVR